MQNAKGSDGTTFRSVLRPLVGALFSSVLLVVSAPVWSQEQPVVEQTAAAKPKPVAEATHGRPADKPYYIEFRARNADSYGHTFSIYGKVNANGKVGNFTVAGLHPISESPLPWMIGHLVVVPSETGASDGDTDDQYVLARFHVALSAEEFKKVVAYVKQHQKNSPMWHAVLYNCNAWVGDVAKFMGMDTPSSPLLMPADYIESLKKLNMGRIGIIGTPVEVATPAQLRQARLKAIAAQGRKSADGPAKSAEHPDAKAQGDKPLREKSSMARPRDTKPQAVKQQASATAAGKLDLPDRTAVQ
ncbi:hypothetical protein [Rhodoplanes sp. Z2-YC6860]|uniref:hypothetical protein n=1 Tax=Rhodoplanes sp. Z2-YC6860 TaxID=674703 RepID=UPI00078E92CF|nr:hypothetical protein [Rhodoplanes sp. Z2-YC6860]AMN44110.1 hypothetical protein RHPLAN_56960 [Rhodoplanes sp. Z2-YC6860]